MRGGLTICQRKTLAVIAGPTISRPYAGATQRAQAIQALNRTPRKKTVAPYAPFGEEVQACGHNIEDSSRQARQWANQYAQTNLDEAFLIREPIAGVPEARRPVMVPRQPGSARFSEEDEQSMN
jgi:hypothetical protein